MNSKFEMVRLTIFVDETDSFHGHNVANSIVQTLRKEGLAGATVLRGVTGFGTHRQVHTAGIVDLSISLPEIIIAIDSEDRINAVLPLLQELVGEGLIAVDPVSCYKMVKQRPASRDIDSNHSAIVHTVSEYMDPSPITVTASDTVSKAIELLLKHQRSQLPVVSENGMLLGMVSSDIILGRVLHIADNGFHLFSLRGDDKSKVSFDIKAELVSKVMLIKPTVVHENTSMTKAVKLMVHEKLTAIPVTREQFLVGILRLPDVLKKTLEIGSLE
jgi:PII-like signaling protein/predicted transcriptional regulator